MLWRDDDVLRVPIGALFRGGDGGWRVFADDDGRARERAVKLGHLNDEFAEVLGGLVAGETVVMNPSNALRDVARIRARSRCLLDFRRRFGFGAALQARATAAALTAARSGVPDTAP